MTDIHVIAKLPEVVGAVLSDPSGALLEAVGNLDGEAVGAVHAFSVQALGQAGEMLGLGTFLRAAVTGPAKTCVLALQHDGVLGVFVDPTKPLAVVEKKIQDLLQE
jgi:predicted regulator of Ras-like GTPase activity (Roadblock/LC7/MglB family)